MKKLNIIGLALGLTLAARAESTNLNYTVAQINTALEIGLANSNTVDRIVAIDAFIDGSNGFANISYTTAELDSALAVAEANSNSLTRIAALETYADTAETDGLADIVFTNLVIDATFSTADGVYTNVDLAGVAGTNSAVVFLQVEPTGSVISPGWSYFNAADVSTSVAGGIGASYLVAGKSSFIICTTSTNGVIKASSETEIELRLKGFLRRKVTL